MPDERQETINSFSPAANSTQIVPLDKDQTLFDNLISFEEPLENTVIENVRNIQIDLLSTPQVPSEVMEEPLQPSINQLPAGTTTEASVGQPPDSRSTEPRDPERTLDSYPFFTTEIEDSNDLDDLEEIPLDQPHKIIISSNTFTAEEGHYVHFISADCNLVNPVGKLLLDTEIINKPNLLAEQPKMGHVITTDNGLFKTFSIIIAENFFDNIKRVDVMNGLKTLRHTLDQNQIKSFRISATEDLHKIPSNEFVKILEEVFIGTGLQIILCNCTITIPSEEDRQHIICEAHDSLIGGHKGVTKTYKRIRSKFHWPQMRNDIQDYIRRCQSCQEQKLVRAKTRQPMLITDTPIGAFTKFPWIQ